MAFPAGAIIILYLTLAVCYICLSNTDANILTPDP